MAKLTLLVLALTLLVGSITAKTIGIKHPASDEELEREEEELFVSPEYVTEAMLASQLLEKEYEKGLKKEMVPERDLMTSALEASFPIIENAETPKENVRSKRTIGFMARLTHCVFTFMSNPNCWSRLTRNQIYRAQKQEREQKEQEQMRLLQQEQQLLLLGGNATVSDLNASNLGTIPSRFSTTTRRPRLFSSVVSTVRNTMKAIFPRVFNRRTSNNNNNDESSQQSAVQRMFNLNLNQF